jgi:predicted deacylase
MTAPLKVQRVAQLDLDALPAGEVSHLLVELVQDALGGSVRVPVIVAKGSRPGPVVGLTAALHGNELNGIPAIHTLMRRISVPQLRGTVVAVVVANVPGMVARQRRFADNVDLNHIMPGVADGNISQVYAYRLVDRVVRHVDALCDLHTASFGRVNCLYIRADMRDGETARLAYRLRPDIIVQNPPHDGTLRGHVQSLGKTALTVEIGNPQRFQRDMVRRTVTGLRAVFAELGMVPARPLAETAPPVICERSSWMYTDAGGMLEVHGAVTDRVTAGQEIATLTSVFGQVVRTYRAPFDGIIIGKSVDPVAETGARIVHLGEVAAAGRYVPREALT